MRVDLEASRLRDPENSRLLNVHRWSDYQEVNSFVDAIYLKHFEAGGKVGIKKRHVKVLLLDLYIAWSDDPTLSIRVHRSPNEYLAHSRYNSLHISKLTIEVIDRLLEVGLISCCTVLR